MDAVDVISSAGEGSNAVQHLSRQVAFLKREFEKLKLEKRQMKEHYEKVQLNEICKNKKITELTKRCQINKDQLERSESDLKISEREVEMLKKKTSKLRERLKCLVSPTGAERSTSFSNLVDESPKFQAFSVSTPKLEQPGSSQNIDLDVTPDLFTSPVHDAQYLAQAQTRTSYDAVTSDCDRPVGRSQKRPYDTEDLENHEQTKYLKITSAAEKNAASKRSVRDTNSLSSLATMNIFKKRELGDRNTNQRSIIQRGFDGLGGHTTHINPIGNLFKRPPVKKRRSTLSNFSKTPPLPSLDTFVILDEDV